MKKLILLAIFAIIGVGGYALLTKTDDNASSGKKNAKEFSKDRQQQAKKEQPNKRPDFSKQPQSKNKKNNTDTNTSTKTDSQPNQNRRPGGNSPQNAARQMQGAMGNSRFGRQNLTSNATQIEAVLLAEDIFSPQLPILAKIQAKVTDNIAATASVRVLKVNVNAGDIVEEGQLLVELDATDLRLSIKTQQALVAQQQSNIRIAKLQYENNLALLSNAKTNLAKQQKLLKDGFSNDTSIEAATDKLRSAQLTVDLFEEEKISRDTNLTSAIVNLQKLESQLDDYYIKAPYQAKVIDLNATLNQKLKIGESVITLIDQNSLIASGQIPASKHNLLTLNTTEAMLTKAHHSINLTLTYLASSAERGAVNVEFLLPKNSDFVVGDTIELNINLKGQNAYIVPSDSIYQGQFVYAIQNNRLQQTQVEVLGYQYIDDQQWTLIQSKDLIEDTQVLATRLSSPATGTSVKVIKELTL